MSKKVFVVFGATGQQGGSIAKYVADDPELSKQYHVRGVTRSPSKPAAQELQKHGIEIVQGDADDQESVTRALQGAHTVFGVTTTTYNDTLRESEMRQGKAMADGAVAAGAEFIIFSSQVNVTKVSGGKITYAELYDVKADIETYIRTLPIKSAFFAPGSFMQNFQTSTPPNPVGDGTFAFTSFINPDTLFPLIDTVDDGGKYVGAILANPDKYEGKMFCSATACYTLEEIVQTMSKVSGKKVAYQQVSEEVYRSYLPGPKAADNIVGMFLFMQDFGYYGADTIELVDWTAKQARGKLTTLEEYFAKHPLKL